MREIDLTVGTYIVKDGKVLLIHHRKLDKWLPVGGHIEKNETPDDAIKREVQEEVGLEIELIGSSKVPTSKRKDHEKLAQPFHVNKHSVGDHDHVCFYYVSRPLDGEISIREEEVNEAKWFSKDELGEVPEDVKQQALKALKLQ